MRSYWTNGSFPAPCCSRAPIWSCSPRVAVWPMATEICTPTSSLMPAANISRWCGPTRAWPTSLPRVSPNNSRMFLTGSSKRSRRRHSSRLARPPRCSCPPPPTRRSSDRPGPVVMSRWTTTRGKKLPSVSASTTLRRLRRFQTWRCASRPDSRPTASDWPPAMRSTAIERAIPSRTPRQETCGRGGKLIWVTTSSSSRSTSSRGPTAARPSATIT